MTHDLTAADLTDIGETLNDLADQLREPGSLRRIGVNRIALILDNTADELEGYARRMAETPKQREERETHEVAVKAASGQRRPKDRIHKATGEMLAGAWEMSKR